jgi:hypothetical protein
MRRQGLAEDRGFEACTADNIVECIAAHEEALVMLKKQH